MRGIERYYFHKSRTPQWVDKKKINNECKEYRMILLLAVVFLGIGFIAGMFFTNWRAGKYSQ